ncbi:MAG TPA: PKD domain-containing protein [Solirubrobacteraceae bacterium]|nr:PKD domain-containing protein [Solirubrobacteraceae bacterium]
MSMFPRALVALLAFLALVPASASAAGWRDPLPLPGPAEVPSGFDVAAGPDGTVVAAWTRRNADGSSQVLASVRPPGGTFSAPEELGSKFGVSPVVAVDGQGTATVVWQQRVGATVLQTIQQATRPAGGSFSRPVDLSSFSGEAIDADIAVNRRGDTLVTWTNRINTPKIEAAARPAGGTFGAAETVSGPDVSGLDAVLPEAAIGEDGSGMIVWTREGGLVRAAPWSAALDNFGEDFTVTEAAEVAFQPDVAVTPTGDAVFVYSGRVTGGEAIRMRTRTSGVVSQPVNLADPTAFARSPRLAAGANGDMLAAWRSGATSSNVVVRGAFRAAGQAFGGAETLSGALTGVTPAPAVAMTPAGDALVAWPVPVSGGTTLQARTRPRSGPFSPIQDDFPVRATPGLVAFADGEGNLGTVNRRDATTLELRPFDNAAPVPLGLTAPADAVAGRPAAFSSAFRDTWSPFTVDWSFGDGGAATGADVEHAYADAGAFTPTATATDAAGNAAAQSAGVGVRALQQAEIDADADGFTADKDCDDADAARHPGAREVRGNDVDENCDDVKAPFRKVRAAAALAGKFGAGFIRLTGLTVTGLAKGDVVTLGCKGPGCRRSAEVEIAVRRATRSLSLTKRVAGLRLRKGARIELRIAHPQRIARILRFTVKRLGEIPVKTERCLPPGAGKPGKC